VTIPAVLVYPFQLVEQVKRVPFWVPAMVWLHPLDLCLRERRDIPDLIGGRDREPNRVQENWKGDSIFLALPRPSGERENTVVQGGSQIEQNIPDYRRNTERWVGILVILATCCPFARHTRMTPS
jgi:hypothetical protein